MKRFYLKLAALIFIILCGLGICFKLVLFPKSAEITDNADLVEVLAKNGISVNSDVFDKELDDVYFGITLENSLGNREKIAKAILGADAAATTANIYGLNGQTVFFSGGGFTFENDRDTDSFGFSALELRDPKKVIKKISAALDMDISSSIINSDETDSGTAYTVTKSIRHNPVSGDSVTALISDGVLKSLKGMWFDTDASFSTFDYASAKASTADALVKFMNLPDRPKNAVVTAVAAGYLISDTSKESTAITPIYTVTLSDGSTYELDITEGG